jgi:hypothetical protein
LRWEPNVEHAAPERQRSVRVRATRGEREVIGVPVGPRRPGPLSYNATMEVWGTSRLASDG